MQRQMEVLEAQLKSEKEFTETHSLDREQEREEYESKIRELNERLSRKSMQFTEIEDLNLQKVLYLIFSIVEIVSSFFCFSSLLYLLMRINIL
jgi:hypothetical protein